MIDPILTLMFGPPLAAILFCGLLWITNRRATAAFDRRTNEHRRRIQTLIDE
jgi:hypothetical protein